MVLFLFSLQYRTITSRFLHESYDTYDYDIAVVCWDDPVQFIDAIQVIKAGLRS